MTPIREITPPFQHVVSSQNKPQFIQERQSFELVYILLHVAVSTQRVHLDSIPDYDFDVKVAGIAYLR